jgi:hypothetical protein
MNAATIVEFLFDFALDPLMPAFCCFEFEQACRACWFVVWTRIGQEVC